MHRDLKPENILLGADGHVLSFSLFIYLFHNMLANTQDIKQGTLELFLMFNFHGILTFH